MAVTPQTEKAYHYTYLKEFRVNQCPLFLQHKCTQHRPFTCFNWHFANQRRRRPIRKRDGTFNYSSDVYCSKYDETTGVCPNGDDCCYLHRNTGDTERRYHLRYYKTGTCIHETDSRGNCVKNGPHCAFAHGAQDLRPPVYDIREVDKNEASQREPLEQFNLSEKIVNDDPKWQDANYVLANYKTEPCKRPPRLCRQGYACPQYHNPKDRRRSPKKYKYRSSPCPNVKQGDDWKDPSCCEKGDSCQFCHTRTEQQFHPEIYKSTKCHDVMQNGYCPRGPFCAFAHVQQEIRVIEESDIAGIFPPTPSVAQTAGSDFGGQLGQLVDPGNISRSAPGDGRPSLGLDLGRFSSADLDRGKSNVWNSESPSFPNMPSPFSLHSGMERQQQSMFQMPSSENLGLLDQNPNSSINSFPSCPSPIAKPNWASSSFGKGDNYARAPGSGRNEFQPHSVGSGMGGLAGSPFSWGSLPANSHLMGRNSFSSNGSSPSSLNRLKSLNCEAKPFYPPDETVDSVVGNALDGFDPNHPSPRIRHRTGSSSRIWPEPIGSGRDPIGSGRDGKNDNSLFAMSAPVNIPQDNGEGMAMGMRLPLRGALTTPSPPIGSNPLFSSLDASRSSFGGGSLPSIGRPPSSSGFTKDTSASSTTSNEATQADLERMQRKCRQWEDCWNQAKTACDAWKKEATEANERAKKAEDSAKRITEQSQNFEEELQKASSEIAVLAEELQTRGGQGNNGNGKCVFLHRAQKNSLLKQITVKDLKDLRSKLKTDLDAVDKVLWESYGVSCEEGWVRK